MLLELQLKAVPWGGLSAAVAERHCQKCKSSSSFRGCLTDVFDVFCFSLLPLKKINNKHVRKLISITHAFKKCNVIFVFDFCTQCISPIQQTFFLVFLVFFSSSFACRLLREGRISAMEQASVFRLVLNISISIFSSEIWLTETKAGPEQENELE